MRFVLVLCLLLAPIAARAQNVTVFAAASLTDAMKDIAAEWTKAGHKPLRLSFGASSSLARQIEQGAPAHVFASADLKWMDYLADKNLIALDTRRSLLGNTLVLIVPPCALRGVQTDLAGLMSSHRSRQRGKVKLREEAPRTWKASGAGCGLPWPG